MSELDIPCLGPIYHCSIRNGSDGFQPGLDGEGCSSIVHDGAVVINSVLVAGVLFLEVVGHFRRRSPS